MVSLLSRRGTQSLYARMSLLVMATVNTEPFKNSQRYPWASEDKWQAPQFNPGVKIEKGDHWLLENGRRRKNLDSSNSHQSRIVSLLAVRSRVHRMASTLHWSPIR
jgi:hypothetical protein